MVVGMSKQTKSFKQVDQDSQNVMDKFHQLDKDGDDFLNKDEVAR
jgi:hypothetical protein